MKKRKSKGTSYTSKAVKLFQSRLGVPVTSEELAQIKGKKGKPISHNIRRIFELRDEMGYNLVNHGDNEKTGRNLKVDEWVLIDKDPDPEKIRARGVNKKIRFDVLARDHSTCFFCGRTPQDDDPIRPGRKVTMHIGHIIAHKKINNGDLYRVENIEEKKSFEGLTVDDFKTMCNVCNEGAKNNDLEILSRTQKIDALNGDSQREIFEHLKKKFS